MLEHDLLRNQLGPVDPGMTHDPSPYEETAIAELVKRGLLEERRFEDEHFVYITWHVTALGRTALACHAATTAA